MAIIDRWLTSYHATPRDLAAYRIVFAIVGLTMFWGRSLWTAELPREFWAPPAGLPRWFGGPVSYEIILGLNIALTITLLMLFIGVLAEAASFAVGLLMMFLAAIHYSYGKIDHDILTVLTPITLALSGWGSKWSVDGLRQRPFVRTWCLNLLAIVVGLGMLTAAIAKFRWIECDSQFVRLWVIHYRDSVGWGGVLTDPLLALPSGFWEPLDWLTLVVEGGMLLAIANQRLFQFACVVACMFHLGIALTLDIPFWCNVLAYAAFFPIGVAINRWYLWLPPCGALTLMLFPWSDGREFVARLVVVSGALMLPALFVWSQFSHDYTRCGES